MKNSGTDTGSIRIDWKWVIAGYCCFVIFHLFPSFFLLDLRRLGVIGSSIWIAIGISILSFIFAYRSRGVTLLEPPLASLLYFLTCDLRFGGFHLGSQHNLARLFAWLAGVIILSSFFALLGEHFKRRKEKELIEQKVDEGGST